MAGSEESFKNPPLSFAYLINLFVNGPKCAKASIKIISMRIREICDFGLFDFHLSYNPDVNKVSPSQTVSDSHNIYPYSLCNSTVQCPLIGHHIATDELVPDGDNLLGGPEEALDHPHAGPDHPAGAVVVYDGRHDADQQWHALGDVYC